MNRQAIVILLVPLSVFAGPASGQAPRCDAQVAQPDRLAADWSREPLPPLAKVGPQEKVILARCKTCQPPVSAMVKTTDLTAPDAPGGLVDTKLEETMAQVLADPMRKRAFADWYQSDVQRLHPGCEVGTEVVGAETGPGGMSFASLFFGARCRGQEREYTSGLEYIGRRGSCGYRMTLLWQGNESLPDASMDRASAFFRSVMLPERK